MTEVGAVRDAIDYIEANPDDHASRLLSALTSQVDVLLLRLAKNHRLVEVANDWLADTDEADEDEPGIHDFYIRVGARWGKGNYYRRFREALDV